MKILKLLLTIFFFANITVNAFDISSLWKINSYVVDKVWVLNEQEKSDVETKIKELKQKYTTEILVIIVPSTDWEDISSMATEIWQKIWVWKSDKDNWVVLLIAIDDRAWNISTWYWVEWVLPDLLTKQIWERNFASFKEKKYYDWIIWALEDFDKVFSWDESIISEIKSENGDENWIWLLNVFITMIASSIFLRPLVKKKNVKKFFLYFFFMYIITLPLTYFFLWVAWIFVNLFICVIWTLVWVFWKSWKWGWGFGWWKWGWGWGFGWFWWWSFWWWWSSWKW